MKKLILSAVTAALALFCATSCRFDYEERIYMISLSPESHQSTSTLLPGMPPSPAQQLEEAFIDATDKFDDLYCDTWAAEDCESSDKSARDKYSKALAAVKEIETEYKQKAAALTEDGYQFTWTLRLSCDKLLESNSKLNLGSYSFTVENK